MKKHVFGRQLQRDTNERKALFKSLMTSLILHESIKTTEAKAKAIKGEIEKLVTKAKKDNSQAERMLQAYFSTPVLRKLIHDVAPRFINRPGGYTRIIKLGNRLRDNSKMVMLEWVEKKPEVVKGEIIQSDEENQITTKKLESTANDGRTLTKKKEKKETKKKKESK